MVFVERFGSRREKKWTNRYLEIAKTVAGWSKDPNYKIGAVIVGSDRQIISQGYNGFPRGMEDSEERYRNRDVKGQFVVHAEMNAIFNAALAGSTIRNSTLYVWGLPPCNECTKGIIQSGITKVVICAGYDIPERWKEAFEMSKIMLKESKVHFQVVDSQDNLLYNVHSN